LDALAAGPTDRAARALENEVTGRGIAAIACSTSSAAAAAATPTAAAVVIVGPCGWRAEKPAGRWTGGCGEKESEGEEQNQRAHLHFQVEGSSSMITIQASGFCRR
jgi:hypothetical protein